MIRFREVATNPELLEVECFACEFAFGTSGSLEHHVLCFSFRVTVLHVLIPNNISNSIYTHVYNVEKRVRGLAVLCYGL